MDAIFISDLHLQDERPDITQGFLTFCDYWGSRTRRLYILGDLFEVWIGDDHETVTSRAVQGALALLASKGVDIRFMHGNRDFLLGSDFAARCGMKLLTDGSVEKIGMQQVLLSHGDAYCTKDTEYQNFRKSVRDPRWITAFLQRPLPVRLQMAQAIRKESVAKGKEKDAYLMDVTEDAVIRAFEAAGSQLLIHGHTHLPAIHSHSVRGKACKRVVLGDWDKQGWMATMEGAAVQLLSFPFSEPAQVRRCGT